eukprot:TRINITY_DN34494_c0_g1_i1.p1 TRINITY_DN34494_c0_g1~~TRINITY_DN34494_c0_g1_i1.p1  ORF type:complete len:231 (-),score=52.45 TRINITY_DN34494_c0_g1_i1:450-1142(-)
MADSSGELVGAAARAARKARLAAREAEQAVTIVSRGPQPKLNPQRVAAVNTESVEDVQSGRLKKRKNRKSSSSSASSSSSSSSSSGGKAKRAAKKAQAAAERMQKAARSMIPNWGAMRASHLLIKYAGSRNPVSKRTGESTAHISEAQAKAELQTYIDKIRAAGDVEEAFAKYAKQRSDCGSYRKGGDLGTFDAEQMQKEFSDATRATDVGTLSGIVKTESGFHVILRTE